MINMTKFSTPSVYKLCDVHFRFMNLKLKMWIGRSFLHFLWKIMPKYGHSYWMLVWLNVQTTVVMLFVDMFVKPVKSHDLRKQGCNLNWKEATSRMWTRETDRKSEQYVTREACNPVLQDVCHYLDCLPSEHIFEVIDYQRTVAANISNC